MRYRSPAVCCLILLILCLPLPVEAASYKSYVFDAWGRAVPTPEPYEPVRIIYGPDLGIGELRGPEDLFVAPDQTIYIVDTRNNRIVRTTIEFEVLDIYAEFERDGVIDRFNNPLGVFVTDYGHMFVADTNNGRIVRFDENGKFVSIIEAPEKAYPEAFSEYFQFRPRKVAVDQVGRLYAVSAGLFDGIMELILRAIFMVSCVPCGCLCLSGSTSGLRLRLMSKDREGAWFCRRNTAAWTWMNLVSFTPPSAVRWRCKNLSAG